MAVTSLDNMVVSRRTDDVALYTMPSPTNIIGANSTTIATGVAIGFTFTFDGVDYTDFAVSPAGFIRFAGTVTSALNSNLFATSANVLLAPWYDAQETATSVGYVQKQLFGSAPMRHLVVEFYCNLAISHDATNYRRAKYQVVLYETKNKIEYRYGPLETGGTGGATTSTASIGCKGVNTVINDNERDFAVDNLLLGASKTTTTQNLSFSGGTWPAYTIIMQPAYPMCGRYLTVGPERLTGIQDDYSQPLQDYANNVNWDYCNYAPPLVNISPDLHGGTVIAGTQFVVVPVTPSADSLSYTVYVGVFAASAGTLSFRVDADAAADPQPQVALDWTNLSTQSPAVLANYNWLTPFTVTIPAATQYLRFRTSNSIGDSGALSILVVPAPIAEPPSSQTACGWLRMGVGAICQQGAAIHPEYLNRMDRNIGIVRRDRKVMVWSACRQDVAGLQMTFSEPRVVSVAPCSLVGQKGATVDVVLYAHDSTNGGEVIIREHGGNSVKFTVDDNGGEFRRQTLTLTLNSEQPLIEMTASPSGTMSLMFAGLIWTPGD